MSTRTRARHHEGNLRSVWQLCAAILAAALLLPNTDVHAQAYPTRAIRLIVPYTPGGSSDILARSIGQRLSESWGQPVVVENKPGANGNLGADLVAKARPDGHTLLLTDIGALCISPAAFPGLPFEPTRDFAAVIMLSYSPHILAVHPGLAVNTVQELIGLATARPGTLNFATAGLGSAPHLAGIEFGLRSGVQWTYIAYKGGSQAIADVAAGHADVLFNGMLATYPFVKGGRLKAIAVSSPLRVAAAPHLPTVAESGLPGFETGSWQGVLAPAGTPPQIVAKLNVEIARILATADMRERLAAQGTEVRAGTPESLARFMHSELSRWAKVVKQSGVKFD